MTSETRWVDVDISLPANETWTLRIRQMAETVTWYWSINEFSVWTRDQM